MLVLSRKLNESICIGDDIQITVLEVRGKRIRLGFTAPAHVNIRRVEHVPATEGDVLQSRRASSRHEVELECATVGPV
jgi:carbon storage regulator